MDIDLRSSSGASSRIRFAPLSSLASEIDPGRTVIVTDAEIARLHGPSFPPCPVALVSRGEAAKSLAALEALYRRFLELGLGRDGTVLAIGGGSVSDLAGFAASTWMRGIDFGFAPTTLLAMVDASVGGKNGVDFAGYKNLIGTFRQPRFVTMDVSVLDTLSDEEFASGMAEAVKCAVLAGEPYFAALELAARGAARGAAGARAGERAPRGAALEALIRPAVELKAAIVSRDEREDGERRLLNLGHSLGHAIEAATGIPHGHAVAAGLAAMCRRSAAAGAMDGPSLDRILSLLRSLGLPASVAQAAALSERRGGPGDGSALRNAMAAALAADKKRAGGDILVVEPRAIGDCVVSPVPLAEMERLAKEAP